jgi:glycosyltransferase involved in cell wall biosynthesis
LNLAIITVGIPTYNSAKFIELTIKSLQAQTYEDWTCLISDDASTDETINICQNLVKDDPRFELFRQPKRLGPHNNWNYLLENSTTELFKLLHADDILHPHALALAIEAFNFDSRIVLVSSNRTFTSNPKLYSKVEDEKLIFKVKTKSQTIKKYLLLGSNFIKEPSFATFKTQILKNTNGFTSSWSYLVDMDTYLKVLDHGQYLKIKKNLGQFRISNSSWSADLNKKQLSEERDFLKFVSKGRKMVYLGLTLVTLRSNLRRLYFYLSAYRKEIKK